MTPKKPFDYDQFPGSHAENPKQVLFRFTCAHSHTHMGLPFTDGDEITIDAAWADVIESQGSGHRLTDKE